MTDVANDLTVLTSLTPGPLRAEDAAVALGIDATEVEQTGEALIVEGALAFYGGGFIAGPRAGTTHSSPIRDTRLAIALAEALTARGADPGEVGLLYARAARWEKARDPLAEAALRPATDGEQAALLAGLALEAEDHVPGLDAGARGRLHLTRARHLKGTGRSQEAMQALDSAVHLLGGVERVDALGFATVVADELQSPQWAETLAALAESEAWTAGETAKAGSLLTLRARMLGRIGFPREADRVLDVGTEILQRHGHEIQRFYAHLNRALVQLDRGEARHAEAGFDRLRDEAKEIEGPISQADKDVYWARAAFAAGHPAGALEAVERAEAAAADHDAPVLAFLAAIARTEGALYFERSQEALEAADRVLELSLAELPVWENRARVLRARALIGLRRPVEAAEEASAARAVTPTGVDGLRLRKEIEAIDLLALPPETPWPKQRAEDVTDELLHAQWHLPALELMIERARRENDEELALQAAGLALDLGIPTEAIRAGHIAGVWDDPSGQEIAFAAQGVTHHLPGPWAEEWQSLPHVAAALAVDVSDDAQGAEELTARWAEVVESGGLAGYEVLSPAQRRIRGLVRRREVTSRLRRAARVAGVAATAAALGLATFMLLATDTPLEERELPRLPERIQGSFTYRADPGRSGVVPDAAGPVEVDGYYWRDGTAAQIVASPVTFGSYVLVAGTDRIVRAYEMRDGRLLWSFEAQGELRATPAVGEFDSRVGRGATSRTLAVFGDENGMIYFRDALDPVATPWVYPAGGRIVGSPLIVDPLVIVASNGPNSGRVLALQPFTGEAWTFPAGDADPIGPISSAPAYHEGIVYVTTTGPNGGLYLIDVATGIEECHLPSLGSLRLPPVVVEDLVYVSAEQVVYVMAAGICRIEAPPNRSGQYPFPGSGVSAAPTVVGDLMIVPSGPDLVAIDLANPSPGSYVWAFASGAPIESSPIVAGDVVYFGNNAGYVFAVPLYPADPTDVRELWKWHTDGAVRSSVAVVDGVAFITSTDGTITAIGPKDWVSRRHETTPSTDDTAPSVPGATTTIPDTMPPGDSGGAD